jgi:hypothetical protein
MVLIVSLTVDQTCNECHGELGILTTSGLHPQQLLGNIDDKPYLSSGHSFQMRAWKQGRLHDTISQFTISQFPASVAIHNPYNQDSYWICICTNCPMDLVLCVMTYVEHLWGLSPNSRADMADFVNTHKVVARRNSVSAFLSERNGGES